MVFTDVVKLQISPAMKKLIYLFKNFKEPPQCLMRYIRENIGNLLCFSGRPINSIMKVMCVI